MADSGGGGGGNWKFEELEKCFDMVAVGNRRRLRKKMQINYETA